MDNKALIKKFSLIPNYIFKAEKRLDIVEDPKERAKILARIEKYQIESRVIKTILKIN